MSLESEVSALNNTLKQLIEVLAARQGTAAPTPAPAAAEPKAKKTKVETITPAVVELTEEQKQERDQKLAEPVIQELLNNGKKADILALNKKFGVERGRQLYGTDKFSEYLAEAKKLGEAAAA